MREQAVWHKLHCLADYPVLAALASKRTESQVLDGRACHYIYVASMTEIDWQVLSVSEYDFMKALGIEKQSVKSI